MLFTLSSVLASLKKFREEVSECPICLEPCTDTLVNPECNHRFCGKCIKESLRKCNHEYPTCRAHIPTYRACRRDPQFDHIVSTVLRRNDIQYVVVCVSIIIMTPLAFNTLLMEICYCVQLDRLGKEFIVPLEKQISSEQEEKQVVQKETQEIVGQKRRACTINLSVIITDTTSISTSSASTEMVAAGGTRRSKRVKVAPTRYVTAEEESWTVSPHDSSGVVTRNTTLTASRPPLDHSSATTDETVILNGRNEDVNIISSQRVSAVAATTRVNKRSKGQKTFDERFKDLMSFKAEFGHCHVPQTRSRNNKHLSLGLWCKNTRQCYKASKLSKADIKRLENAGFEWSSGCKKYTFDERFKDLMFFKEEFGHCNVPRTNSRNNNHLSLGCWCRHIRQSYKAIKKGGKPSNKLSKADIQRLENAGFEWNLCKKFDDRFNDLMAFKAEFGHCNVPAIRSRNNEHLSLGCWCNYMRRSYKAIKKGGMPRSKLSKADIRRLEKAGFEWRFR